MPIHRIENFNDEMIWPTDDFTGEWIVEWPNGKIKFCSLYSKGKAEGDYLCYWENGNLAQKGYSSDGVCVGIWSDFWEDGTKFKETEFFSPENFDVRWLTPNGRVGKIEIFRAEKEPQTKILVPEFFDETSR